MQGFCIDSGGYVYCAEPTGCEGKAVGDVCSDAGGHCASQDGVAQDGAAPDGGVPVGVAPDGPLYCELSCEGKPDGDPCQSYYSTHGYCFQNECMPLYPAGSGIDGLGVDACGNVYATEFTSGIVWRIDPEGQLEQLVRLPSSWIPNVKWGHDVGGFSSTTMYVADLDSGRLFALPVGVPSAEAVLKRGAEQ